MTQIFEYSSFLNRIHPVACEIFQYYLISIPIEFKVGGPWLCGGSIRRVISDRNFKDADFDVFFKDDLQFKSIYEKLQQNNFKITNEQEHAVTFEQEHDVTFSVKIQLIKMHYYPDISSCINDFDYTVAMCGFDGSSIYLGDYTLYDIARKRLAVNKVKYPVAMLRRLIKYTKQGYYACNGCLQEIANAIHTMDPIDFKQHKTMYVD